MVGDRECRTSTIQRRNYLLGTSFFTVVPVKPWTPEKISGMFIVSRPFRCKMKPQKITDKPQQDQSRRDTKKTSWPFFYEKSSIFPLYFSEKAIFLPQTNTGYLIPSVQNPNNRIDLKVGGNRFLVYQKIRIENHQSQPTSMIFWTARETNTEEHCLWLAHFSRAQTSCLAVSDRPDPLFRKISFIYIPPKPKSRKRNFNISDRKNWRFLVEENTSSLFRVKTWLINAAVWRLSFAVSSHIWLVAKQ